MKQLVTRTTDYFHSTNKLTEEMDKYLVSKYKYIDHSRTYVYDTKFEMSNGNTSYAIRYPGATRGHIEIDSNDIIVAIKLYKDSYNTHQIYRPEVEECFDKYIGMKLVMI